MSFNASKKKKKKKKTYCLLLKIHLAYKCSEFGVWTRGDSTIITGARLSDNQIGVSQPQGRQVTQDRFEFL